MPDHSARKTRRRRLPAPWKIYPAREHAERQRLEEAYRLLVEHSLQGLLIYQDGRVVFANSRMSEICGYSVSELLAHSPEQIFATVHPEDLDLVLTMLHDRLAGRPTPSRYEYRIIRKDGALRWLEARGVRISFRGRPALQGAYIDITERRLAEEALRAERSSLAAIVAAKTYELRHERDRTRAILESLGEAVMVVTTDGTIEYLNPAAVSLTGIDETNTQSWTQLFADQLPFDLQAALAAGRDWQGEVLIRHSSGLCYDAAMSVTPLFDPDQPMRMLGFVCAHRDVSPMKVAARMKDQFVSNVSHELRSPTSLITMLSGSLEMLYHRMDDTRRLQIIADIRKHARVLSDLIGSVLEISRIDGGRVALEQQYLNLAQLASEELAQITLISRKKSITLLQGGEDDLPVRGHAGQLQQVIRNLLSNAVKYTPDGGCISCTCRRLLLVPDAAEPDGGPWPGLNRLPRGAWATLRISDTGIGIGPHDLPHIFERFYRAQTQGDIPGTGLGLSIASELVKRHAGYLEVVSALDQGSSFVIYLPLAEALP